MTPTATTTFSGNVIGGSLVKEGIGTLILNRPTGNDYTGGTTAAGTLLVNNSTGSGTGSGANVIFGTLGGSFTLVGDTQLSGTLRTGTLIGTGNFGNSLFLVDTAQTEFELAGAFSADKVNVAGLLTLDGTVTVLTIGGYVGQPDDTIDLFDWGTLDASNFNPGTDLDFTGAAVAPGASWVGPNFLIDGTIKVVPEPTTCAMILVGAALLVAAQPIRRRRHQRG